MYSQDREEHLVASTILTSFEIEDLRSCCWKYVQEAEMKFGESLSAQPWMHLEVLVFLPKNIQMAEDPCCKAQVRQILNCSGVIGVTPVRLIWVPPVLVYLFNSTCKSARYAQEKGSSYAKYGILELRDRSKSRRTTKDHIEIRSSTPLS
ncbi:hypothetical protein BC827DRAFT_1277161 [Russula dissimulans]|nr:hypothetical protein BC827DRAFT_1277161 [Russula dissimulans]